MAFFSFSALCLSIAVLKFAPILLQSAKGNGRTQQNLLTQNLLMEKRNI